eukprot:gene9322-biopygen21217
MVPGTGCPAPPPPPPQGSQGIAVHVPPPSMGISANECSPERSRRRVYRNFPWSADTKNPLGKVVMEIGLSENVGVRGFRDCRENTLKGVFKGERSGNPVLFFGKSRGREPIRNNGIGCRLGSSAREARGPGEVGSTRPSPLKKRDSFQLFVDKDVRLWGTIVVRRGACAAQRAVLSPQRTRNTRTTYPQLPPASAATSEGVGGIDAAALLALSPAGLFHTYRLYGNKVVQLSTSRMYF